MTTQPRLINHDNGEISVTLDGREIRGWSYANDDEERTKMLAAKEFCEGWYQATKLFNAAPTVPPVTVISVAAPVSGTPTTVRAGDLAEYFDARRKGSKP